MPVENNHIANSAVHQKRSVSAATELQVIVAPCDPTLWASLYRNRCKLRPIQHAEADNCSF